MLAPEVQLLHKSKQPRPKDQADFEAVLPSLTGGQREWLRAALTIVSAGHPWLRVL